MGPEVSYLWGEEEVPTPPNRKTLFADGGRSGRAPGSLPLSSSHRETSHARPGALSRRDSSRTVQRHCGRYLCQAWPARHPTGRMQDRWLVGGHSMPCPSATALSAPSMLGRKFQVGCDTARQSRQGGGVGEQPTGPHLGVGASGTQGGCKPACASGCAENSPARAGLPRGFALLLCPPRSCWLPGGWVSVPSRATVFARTLLRCKAAGGSHPLGRWREHALTRPHTHPEPPSHMLPRHPPPPACSGGGPRCPQHL